MKNILHIISSPRGTNSYSIRLGRFIVRQITEKNGGGTIVERDLTRDVPPFLSATQIKAFYQKPELRSDEENRSLRYSDEAIREIQQADIIVIGTPMYNMSISTLLKAWIDQIVRIGVSFEFKSDGTKIGLFKNKKVYIAIASGRVNPNGNSKFDFMESYLKIALESVGITDVTVFKTEGTARKVLEEENYEEIIHNL